jgi:hypothetical protein
MTERELKQFAMVGILIRIEELRKRINRAKSKEEKSFFQEKFDYLKQEQKKLLAEIIK